jgi:RNA polymerase sigma-70 factor (ECF subfamily)
MSQLGPSGHLLYVTPSPADAARFEALYREHYADVARFVHRRTEPSAAEAAVAETFAIAWRRLDDVPRRPLPWLFVVARNVLRGERRAAERYRSSGGLTRERAPVEASELVAEHDHETRAFLSLAEPDRETLRLVVWDGLGHRDAAHVAGATLATFTLRASRARRRFAAELARLERAAVPAQRATSQPQEAGA